MSKECVEETVKCVLSFSGSFRDVVPYRSSPPTPQAVDCSILA